MKTTSRVRNIECMNGMKRYEDGYFDLAVVDPPYAILGKSGTMLDKYGVDHKTWDLNPPDEEYFNELFRVSKNQIVWGGNYFPPLWKERCRGIIFWYKHQPLKNWSAGELAWTSYKSPAMCFDYPHFGAHGMDKWKFHPTQKPVALYLWIYEKFAKPGYKILDTHLGSGSSRIAAVQADMGLDFTGFESNETYYQKHQKFFKKEMMRINRNLK